MEVVCELPRYLVRRRRGFTLPRRSQPESHQQQQRQVHFVNVERKIERRRPRHIEATRKYIGFHPAERGSGHLVNSVRESSADRGVQLAPGRATSYICAAMRARRSGSYRSKWLRPERYVNLAPYPRGSIVCCSRRTVRSK